MRKLFVGLVVAALLTGCAVLFASPVLATTVQVFSWSGGSLDAGNDMRDSSSFALKGGSQTLDMSVACTPGDEWAVAANWYVQSADGKGQFKMISTSVIGQSQSAMYLPAGSYYVESNTANCTWSISISETRADPTPAPTPTPTAKPSATPTPFSAPVITKIEPTSGVRGSPFTITGTGFLGDMEGLYFGGYLRWPQTGVVQTTTDTQIVDAVPTGSYVVDGVTQITVYAYHNDVKYTSNAVDFTVLADPSWAYIEEFKVNGWTPSDAEVFPVVIKLKKSVTARGSTSLSGGGTLAGSQIVLTVQKQQAGAWAVVKTASVTISPMKTFSWKYKPAKKGSYCIQAAILATATNTAAETEWFPFRVK